MKGVIYFTLGLSIGLVVTASLQRMRISKIEGRVASLEEAWEAIPKRPIGDNPVQLIDGEYATLRIDGEDATLRIDGIYGEIPEEAIVEEGEIPIKNDDPLEPIPVDPNPPEDTQDPTIPTLADPIEDEEDYTREESIVRQEEETNTPEREVIVEEWEHGFKTEYVIATRYENKMFGYNIGFIFPKHAYNSDRMEISKWFDEHGGTIMQGGGYPGAEAFVHFEGVTDKETANEKLRTLIPELSEFMRTTITEDVPFPR